MLKKISWNTDISLFEGIGKPALDTTLQCLGARKKTYHRDEIIILAGDPAEYVGIVLSGEIIVSRDDYFGNSAIMAHLGAGELFLEVFVCAGVDTSPVTVKSAGDSEILFIEFGRIRNCCEKNCVSHASLIENMLRIIAKKALFQNFRIEILSTRGIRGRINTYLLAMAKQKASPAFEIPFNRAELAEFLCVDRSALSKELSVMREEGLIDFSKNRFEIRRNLAEHHSS